MKDNKKIAKVTSPQFIYNYLRQKRKDRKSK